MSQTLYEKDYYLWLEKTVQLLQDGKLSEIDRYNLIEEIADMGKSQKQAIKSNLRVLLMHLLKWKYQPIRRSNSWKASIVEHRKRIRDSFQDSPSLKPYFAEVFQESYQDARDLAAAETGLDSNIFPMNCPFTSEETLNPSYFPD